ncbi:hypothetical protein ERJ75_000865600 [Trypanosoma vivax]|nr:hypothetical protein ERJ75_000865600 [Trypanosoma vivax]
MNETLSGRKTRGTGENRSTSLRCRMSPGLLWRDGDAPSERSTSQTQPGMSSSHGLSTPDLTSVPGLSKTKESRRDYRKDI